MESPFKRIVDNLKQWDWHAFWRTFWIALMLAVFLIAVPGSRPDPQDKAFQTLGAARNYLFNFVQWEVETLADKTLNGSLGAQHYMSQQERTQYVRDYIALVADIENLESQVEDIYANPDIQDPAAASADLRAQRDQLRARQESEQALAESIIQSQIAEELVDYGFGVGGQLIPPVELHFTQLPTLLVISPRDHIERIGAYPLEHGLTVDQMDQIERNVDQTTGDSSLIVPLGGLAVWPSMLIETGYLPNVYAVGAHEWTHHYLALFPLGENYGVTADLITMNETVANIVGNEIGWAVLKRYYPDLAGPPPIYSPNPPPPAPTPSPGQPQAFDFRATMHATRVQADALLAEGKIDEAEQYMEAQRRIFVENGYQIRKLNQAYFAFYGSYADQPGATGSDPIGPALNALRYYSPSLHDFLLTVRGMTSFAQVQQKLDQLQQASGAGGPG